MSTTKKTRFDFYVLSGEGTGQGMWKLHHTTDLGIKQRLTRERCGGDRWARAYCLARGASFVGIDIETGEARDLSTAVSALHF